MSRTFLKTASADPWVCEGLRGRTLRRPEPDQRELVRMQDAGHINIASGHGDWPLGLALLQSLTGAALQPVAREAAAAA